ncbi:NADH-quinone oxidoreductase subunit A [Streptomyces sp. DSM 44917]|uniref:NADH-quinone oxidoreductase subunit n=1 Tax=Streptomyces boetiae TaxID=3075541 RepID=A0ABU2L4N7_9ACTN|nr:NADH-quinone oxidoreductase subunit A [Streptomyces sp. DSM 44917]MDT0306519.1 NADH-quinone oxidoreductase subunit A [Streptomyces sp. DSM 44917]
MSEWEPVLVALGSVSGALAAVYGTARWLAGAGEPLRAGPFSGGPGPAEHAVSRFHVRWYAVTMIFLAFDMEMLFMYPWAVVVAEVGTAAVVEMFVFLGILLAGVGYAWREGAFRWS